MVLCDIGNSFFHFYKNGRMWKEPLNESFKTEISEPLYFISVNEKGTKKLISKYPHATNIESLIVLDTSYQGLGIDRIAACVAVSDGVVIDAGSAITVDIMQNSVHLGGFILPGLSAFSKCYKSISERLNKEINLHVNLDAFPLNTEDAISYGILKSVVLILKDSIKSKQPFFTGGDGKYLAKFFDNAIFDSSLIFKGMLKSLQKAGIS